eukprot:gnl/TRDRNA2_/TRDRNA2_80251_c0_seq1.p1 gnl/TRDRNA2_/TRDRNA2_80251_c0~~gnl/TRDRNA2_/TRDRNA2_80251_c0_seq1.p1  ORF type:complete len:385 (-),score=82.84 gnl/TRDRNA2_/TRDRNA2_80251_c0_seq1:196-1350(-)
MELRYILLAVLCLQNSMYTLLRRYSRGILQETYSSSSVLAVSELVKFVVSAMLVEIPDAARGKVSGAGLSTIVHVIKEGQAMAVPALVYLLMNVLSFMALERIDATVFAMVAQLKILATAVFCRQLLGRVLPADSWRAIWLLTLAVMIITYQRGQAERQGKTLLLSADFVVGCSMVIAEITLSGFISAYFEKYLKDGHFSVWSRNLQLSFWSLLMYAIPELPSACRSLLMYEEEASALQQAGKRDVAKWSLFEGWSVITCLIVMLGSGGGLLVAFATKHADAVAKAVASSTAIIIVVTMEVVFLGTTADPVVFLAAGVAVIAIENYRQAGLSSSTASSTPAQSANVTETSATLPPMSNKRLLASEASHLSAPEKVELSEAKDSS